MLQGSSLISQPPPSNESWHFSGRHPPRYAHDNSYDDGDLYSSNNGCDEDVRELLPAGYHVENTKVCLLTVLSGVARFTSESGEEEFPVL